MLPKKERLNTEEFKKVIEKGKTIRSDFLYTKILKTDTDQEKKARFAVSVPKKLLKGAVQRHILKRRIMASLRNQKNKFKDGDYIIFATEQIKDKRGIVLDKIVENLAEKVAQYS